NEGRLAGAGIDVMDVEPPDKDDPILNNDRIIVTPHIAWYSEESLKNLMEYSMDEIERVLKGRRPRWILNPEVL
ncbi:MAG: C-terminal binding protein, partial [Spirochaetes bacterium]